MRYKKGTFIVIPNKDLLKGKPAEMQSIYTWLCEHADEDGVCFPTKATIAREAGCSHNTVDKYLKQLVEDGFLSITQRKKKGSKENTSNSYQIMLKETDDLGSPPPNNGMTCPPNSGLETNPSINQPNLTVIANPKEEKKVTLSSKGESPVKVLQRVYGLLFKHLYGFAPKADYASQGKVFKDLLESYTEIQIACLLIVYFNWRGMNDDDQREKDWLISKAHPIFLFRANVSKYQAHVLNVKGISEFDNDDELLKNVRKSLADLSTQ